MKAPARATPKPIQPVFHSQILRRHIRAFGVVREAVGPGTKRRHIRAMMTPGMMIDTMRRTLTDTVSFNL